MTLKHYREELYVGIYLSELRSSITSQIRGSLLSRNRVSSLTTIFFAALCVTTDMSSSPLSSALSDTTHPSAMVVLAPQARDDGLPPCSDDGRPPRGRC